MSACVCVCVCSCLCVSVCVFVFLFSCFCMASGATTLGQKRLPTRGATSKSSLDGRELDLQLSSLFRTRAQHVNRVLRFKSAATAMATTNSLSNNDNLSKSNATRA